MKGSGAFENLGKNIVVVLSLLSAGFFAAWLRYQPHLGSSGSYTDGVRQYESFADEPIRFAVWEEPESLAGAVNSEEGEHSPTLSKDGRWLVFVGGERGRNAELWIAEMEEGESRHPRPLYELNTRFDELSPAFDGTALYFASNRPGGPGGFDLWKSDFVDGEFAAPQILEGELNTSKDEVDPAPLPGGQALAFASNRNTAGRKGHDLYLARPALEGNYSVTPLEGLNSYQDDRELAFTADGRRVFFASDRDGERGSFDLYSSLYERGAWLPPRAVDGLNSEDSERAPTPTQDGFGLLFEKRRLDDGLVSAADLFHARSLEVFQRPGPQVGWLDLLILIALLVLALLAALAKRWETIEVLYKCFLVSLLAHAALLWWFRDIHPESEIAELPQRGPTYQVSLASNSASSASTQERGGQLETSADSSRLETASLQRGAPSEARALPAQTPSEAQVARRPGQALEVPEATATEAAEAAPASAEVVTAAELQDAQAFTRQAVGRVAAMVVDAPASGVRAERDSVETSNLDRRVQANVSALPSNPREVVVARQAGFEAPELPRLEAPSFEIDGPTQSTEPALAEAEELRAPEDFQPASKTGGAAMATEDDDLGSLLAANTSAARREGAPSEERANLRETQQRELDLQATPNSWSAQGPRPRVEDPGSQSATPNALAAETPSPQEVEVPMEFSGLREPEAGAQTTTLAAATADLASELSPTSTASAPRRRSAEPTPVASRLAPRERRSLERAPEPKRASFETEERLAEAMPAVADVRDFEHTPYRTRFGPAKARALEEYGGSDETEAAVASGLDYLASIQHELGFWGDARSRDEKYGSVFVGKTGLSLLAFLGAGHTQDSSSDHSLVVERALTFLIGIQRDESGHFGRTSAYSHGIATYALAENFALTADARLRAPLERAVEHILSHQNRDRRDRREFGGWSYYYTNDRTFDSWPRVSITAWQVMALESARLGGIEVPDRAFTDARRFLVNALDPAQGCFRYSHDPDRLNGPFAILPGSTPAALFALSLLGVDLEDEELDDAWRFVEQRSPAEYRYTSDQAFVSRAQGNLYFWYYGSLACLRRGGNTWNRWNLRLKEALLESQRGDGSWRPISIYARDYAEDDSSDASYSTAMNVLSLEVYYRYFTPLLDVNHGSAGSDSMRSPR